MSCFNPRYWTRLAFQRDKKSTRLKDYSHLCIHVVIYDRDALQDNENCCLFKCSSHKPVLQMLTSLIWMITPSGFSHSLYTCTFLYVTVAYKIVISSMIKKKYVWLPFSGIPELLETPLCTSIHLETERLKQSSAWCTLPRHHIHQTKTGLLCWLKLGWFTYWGYK